MHIIPMEINYKLSLTAREIAEIVRAAKEWGYTPQKTIEAILREWAIVRMNLSEKDKRLLAKVKP